MRTDKETAARIYRWTHAQQGELREEAKRAIASGWFGDSLYLRQIRSNTVDANSLFRAMTVPPDDPLFRLRIGENFDMLPSSFSRSETVASWYFRSPYKPLNLPVFFFLMRVGDPIRGFDIAEYLAAYDNRVHTFQEVVVGGRFRLMNRQPLHEGFVFTIRQLGGPRYLLREPSFFRYASTPLRISSAMGAPVFSESAFSFCSCSGLRKTVVRFMEPVCGYRHTLATAH